MSRMHVQQIPTVTVDYCWLRMDRISMSAALGTESDPQRVLEFMAKINHLMQKSNSS